MQNRRSGIGLFKRIKHDLEIVRRAAAGSGKIAGLCIMRKHFLHGE